MQTSPMSGSEAKVYKAPKPLRATKAGVWKFAESAREKLGVSSGFDLAGLVDSNGGRILHIGPFDPDQTDAIRIEPDNTFEIRLSSLSGALRDHFTIAHELAHLMLHWPIVREEEPGVGMRATRSVDRDDSDLMRCEWEANWFASAFLMPREEFKVAFRNGAEEKAAARFGVSPAAAKVRAITLGIR